MYITQEDRLKIEALLNDTFQGNLEVLKKLIGQYGGPVHHSCFCKESNKREYLTRVREWYTQNQDD